MRILNTALAAFLAATLSTHADEPADGVTFIHGPLLSQAEEEKPKEISAECQAFRADPELMRTMAELVGS